MRQKGDRAQAWMSSLQTFRVARSPRATVIIAADQPLTVLHQGAERGEQGSLMNAAGRAVKNRPFHRPKYVRTAPSRTVSHVDVFLALL